MAIADSPDSINLLGFSYFFEIKHCFVIVIVHLGGGIRFMLGNSDILAIIIGACIFI